MSDTPLSHVGSSGARLADECVQSRWDRFAMSDLSDDRASRPLAMGNHRAHHHSTFAPEEVLVENAPGARGRLRHVEAN